MRRLPLFALLGIFLLTGCSLRLTSTKVVDGGVFRSPDNGETWEQKVFVRQEKKRMITISDVDVLSIAASPSNPDELTITTLADGVYRTENGGDAWAALPLSAGNYPAFAYDPSTSAVQYTATGPQVLKSGDSGEHWESVYTDSRGEGVTALAVDWYDTHKVFAGTSGGTLLQSLNNGNEWSVVRDFDTAIRGILMSTADSRILYAVTADRGVQRSVDGGSQWSQLEGMSAFDGGSQVRQLLPVPGTPGLLYAATNFGLLRSTDGGTTWTSIKTLVAQNTIPLRAVAVNPQSPNTLFVAVNNLIHKSDDAGLTWKTIETVPTQRLILRVLAHPQKAGLLYLGTVQPQR